ncbi:MAG: DUF4249 domain-containing protein [Emticicia sp.]|nr:DUF4249 domain-containing protein [Emticicia sp.]
MQNNYTKYIPYQWFTRFVIRKSKIVNILILALSLIGISCLDEYKVPLRQETEKLVIEGLLTNDPLEQYLRLSLTTQFGSASNITPANGAFVEIVGDNKESVIFRPVPSDLGIYKPNLNSFKAQFGVSYVINIKLPDGRIFKSAPQKMLQPVPVNKLNATFSDTPPYGFRISLDFKDPAETKNFYRWTARGYYQRQSVGVPVGFGGGVCCNRCWVLKEDKSVNILSDALVNGGMIKERPAYFSPFFVLGQHLIEVKQYNISQEAYTFWKKYQDQQTRTGTIFDPLPAPLQGNVVNISDPSDIALGFFEVAAISKIRIEPFANTQGVIAFNLQNPLYIPAGDCMLAFPFSVYSAVRPPNW